MEEMVRHFLFLLFGFSAHVRSIAPVAWPFGGISEPGSPIVKISISAEKKVRERERMFPSLWVAVHLLIYEPGRPEKRCKTKRPPHVVRVI